MSLFQLLYISNRRIDADDDNLLAIQSQASDYNQKRGVTGVLLCYGPRFLQLLEGAPTEIAALYARVVEDPRHSDCTCLHFGPAEQRVFPDWSMGVFDLHTTAPGVEAQLMLDLRMSLAKPDANQTLRVLQAFADALDAHAPSVC